MTLLSVTKSYSPHFYFTHTINRFKTIHLTEEEPTLLVILSCPLSITVKRVIINNYSTSARWI